MSSKRRASFDRFGSWPQIAQTASSSGSGALEVASWEPFARCLWVLAGHQWLSCKRPTIALQLGPFLRSSLQPGSFREVQTTDLQWVPRSLARCFQFSFATIAGFPTLSALQRSVWAASSRGLWMERSLRWGTLAQTRSQDCTCRHLCHRHWWGWAFRAC